MLNLLHCHILSHLLALFALFALSDLVDGAPAPRLTFIEAGLFVQLHELLYAVFDHFDNVKARLVVVLHLLLVVHFFIENLDLRVVSDFDLQVQFKHGFTQVPVGLGHWLSLLDQLLVREDCEVWLMRRVCNGFKLRQLVRHVGNNILRQSQFLSWIARRLLVYVFHLNLCV